MGTFELHEDVLLDTVRAARDLLGCMLVRREGSVVRRARIVETEAYLHDDPASHSFCGPTARNQAMFGPPGRAYVYRIHRAICFNVVTGPEEVGEAVLIRAVEPVEGIERMEEARRRSTVGRTIPTRFALSSGPGKLCQALDITLDDNGCDLLRPSRFGASRSTGRSTSALRCDADTWLALEPRASSAVLRIECDTRIGISQAREAPLRFFIADNRWVSTRRREPPIMR